MLFERFAIELLLVSKNQTKTAIRLWRTCLPTGRLRTSFDSIHHIIQSAVERGLARREATVPVRALGIDEKSFKSNHQYITVLSNLDSRCVLDVVEHRTEETAQQLVSTALTEEQRHSVEAMCMDIWKPFMKTATGYVTNKTEPANFLVL